MARRLANIEPAVLTIDVNTGIVNPGITETHFCDISQMASIVNRRFYRQGLNWVVGSFKVQSLEPAKISVSKIPSTWVAFNAWMKIYSHWNKQIKDTLSEGGNESLRARWSDFKIFMNQSHRTAGFALNLLPRDSANNVGVAGEWEGSHVVLPQTAADGSGTLIDPTEFTLHMVGASTGSSKGMIEGYADSRSFPQSPDPVGPSAASPANWLSSMFDDGSANPEILDNAENENDDLPYSQVDYPGGGFNLPALQSHDIVNIYSTSGTTNVGYANLKGGAFPCGLVAIEYTNNGAVAASLTIQINMVPGPHRGYLAASMQEM